MTMGIDFYLIGPLQTDGLICLDELNVLNATSFLSSFICFSLVHIVQTRCIVICEIVKLSSLCEFSLQHKYI